MSKLTESSLYKWHKLDALICVTGAIAAFLTAGLLAGVMVFAILYVVEVVFSFDNAVINSKILGLIKGQDDVHTGKLRRRARWIAWIVAVVGMRWLFPTLMVVATAKLALGQAIALPFTHATAFKAAVEGANLQIAIIGGTMLIAIFLSFLFDDREPEEMWLSGIEKWFAAVGKNDVLVLAVIVPTIDFIVIGAKHMPSLFTYAIPALVIYGLITILSAKAEDSVMAQVTAGIAKAFARLVAILCALDASLSLDSVQGGLSVTHNPVLLVLGLGAGSWTVMSLTLRFVNEGTVEKLKYLEHGAYYAIGGLGVLTYVSMFTPVNAYIAGAIGIFFVTAGAISSIVQKDHDESEAQPADGEVVSMAGTPSGGSGRATDHLAAEES